VRRSVRGLRLNPSATLAAVLSLALAMGVEAPAGHQADDLAGALDRDPGLHENPVLLAPGVLAVPVAVPGAAAGIPVRGATRGDPCEALRGSRALP